MPFDDLKIGEAIEIQAVLPEALGSYLEAGWRVLDRRPGPGGWMNVLVYRKPAGEIKKTPRI